MSDDPIEDGGTVTIGGCTEQEVPAIAALLAEAFTRFDPPAVAVGLTVADFEPFVAAVLGSATTRTLTSVARDVAGRPIGAMVAEDADPGAAVDLSFISPRFEPIFALLGELEDRAGVPIVTAPGTTLHLFLVGVDAAHTGRGIAGRLVEHAIGNGARLGYREARVEATHPASQRVFLGRGFHSYAQVRYADFRHEGAAVFASISDAGGPMALRRALP